MHASTASRRDACLKPPAASRAGRRRVATRAQQVANFVESPPAAAATGTEALFKPLQLGAYELKHRVVMSPLSRNRALGGVPQPNMVQYYQQRASDGGLIISEATFVSETAVGAPHTPTLYLPESLEGWKPVVKAIHGKGGLFFMQLWHSGRASHPDYQPGGRAPLAPSAVPITGPFKIFSPKDSQMHDYPVPRAMGQADIRAVVHEYKTAAENAVSVGADGVEIHCGSGYLINQFLDTDANRRAGAYGGSMENRARFALEVLEAVCEAVGTAGKVSVKLTPFGRFLATPDEHTYSLYTYLLTELNKFGLAYVHLVEPRSDDPPVSKQSQPDSLAPFRQAYAGNVIVAGGHKGASAAQAIEAGAADAVAFGRWFISNPDLPRRLALGAPLTSYNRDLFYAQCDEGYIDYPSLDETDEGRALLAAL